VQRADGYPHVAIQHPKKKRYGDDLSIVNHWLWGNPGGNQRGIRQIMSVVVKCAKMHYKNFWTQEEDAEPRQSEKKDTLARRGKRSKSHGRKAKARRIGGESIPQNVV